VHSTHAHAALPLGYLWPLCPSIPLQRRWLARLAWRRRATCIVSYSRQLFIVRQGWKPEYPTNAIAISSPNGPWGGPDGAYWKMAPNEYANGDAVDCTEYGHGCWQIPPE
jgi:hypothetical protein